MFFFILFFCQVIVIFATQGTLKCRDLVKISINDVQDLGTSYNVGLLFKYLEIGPRYYSLVKKYISLHPEDTESSKFLVNHKERQCTKQVIQPKKLDNSATLMAWFLNLDDTQHYNVDTFRRNAAAALSNADATLFNLQTSSGWGAFKNF